MMNGVTVSRSYEELVSKVDLLVAGKLTRQEALSLEEMLAEAALSDFRVITLAHRANPFIRKFKSPRSRKESTSDARSGRSEKTVSRKPARGKKNRRHDEKRKKKLPKSKEPSVVEIHGNKIRIYRKASDAPVRQDGNQPRQLTDLKFRRTSMESEVNRLMPYGTKIERRKEPKGSVYAILAGSPGSGRRR